MNLKKLGDTVYNWPIIYGPKLLLGIIVLLCGIWLIRLLKKAIQS